MDCFLLFNILDHICTTCFVFANLFGKSFSNYFANSQRYMNMIVRSIFKIWNFSPCFKCFSFRLNTTPPEWNSPLSFQEGFNRYKFWKYTIWKKIPKGFAKIKQVVQMWSKMLKKRKAIHSHLVRLSIGLIPSNLCTFQNAN